MKQRDKNTSKIYTYNIVLNRNKYTKEIKEEINTIKNFFAVCIIFKEELKESIRSALFCARP